MSKVVNQKCIVIRSRTQNPYFKIQNKRLQIKSQHVVVKSICFSVDPVMKFFLAGTKTYFRRLNVGDMFNCFGLARIIQGNQDFQLGQFVFGNIGTCDINIIDEERQRQIFVVPTELVEMYGPHCFVYLINNGLAAYSGYEIMKPKQNQVVVVSTASGATGLLLCQLLKMKKCKVIGLTSTNKLDIVKRYADIVVDYKDNDKLIEVLKNNKFSSYFDNVGERLLDTVLKYMSIGGKVALCGAIANYDNYQNRGIDNVGLLISKRITMKGLTFMDKFPQMAQIFEQYRGVEMKITQINMEEFNTYFTELLKSGNTIMGKVIVQV